MGLPSEDRAPVNGNGNSTPYDDRTTVLKETSTIANGQPNTSTRYGNMDVNASQDRSERQLDPNSDVDPRQRSKAKDRRPSGQQRTCGKCKTHLTGQFVRALGDTYHLECFTCHVRSF